MAIEAPVLKSPRELYRPQLLAGLEQKRQEIFDGSLEGTRIVLWDDVLFVTQQPMDTPSLHGAEVATPGRVVVFAVCPRCGQSAPIALEVQPELRVDSHGGHLHLKGKSKPVTHVCGQIRADLDVDDGQQDFDLEDFVGDADTEAAADQGADSDDTAPNSEDDSDAPVVPDAPTDVFATDALPDDTVVKACDWPRCTLPLGHEGVHDVPPDAPRLPVDDAEDDSELLPF